MMKTEFDNILEFFLENEVVKQAVSIRKINELAGLPTNTLMQVLKGYRYRTLSQEQIDSLIQVIVKIGYKPIRSGETFI